MSAIQDILSDSILDTSANPTALGGITQLQAENAALREALTASQETLMTSQETIAQLQACIAELECPGQE